MRKSILLFFSVFIYSFSFAGGFQVNLQGAKQNMMGHTGTALSLDASSIFFNPAGLSFLEKRYYINAGVNLVFPRVGYAESSPTFYTAGNTNKFSNPLLLYTSFRFKEDSKFTFGFGLNNPFGSTLQYDDDWAGQFVIREISLKTFCYQPTVSYKISDKLSFGAALNYYRGSLVLRKGIPLVDSLGNYGEARLDGEATGMGFNAGLFYKMNEKWSFGLNYRSQTTVKLKEGKAEFDVPSALNDSFPNTTFVSQIKLPQVASLGVAYNLSEKWMFTADINYTGWQSYDTLKFDYKFNSEPLEDTKITKNYKGSFAFRAGGQYKVNDMLIVRGGAFYDMTPVKDGYLTPDGPDANRIGLCTGVSVQPTQKFNIDLAFMYLETQKRTGGSEEQGFYGTYKVKAVIPTIAFQFMF